MNGIRNEVCKIMHIDTEYYKFYDHLYMVNKVT